MRKPWSGEFPVDTASGMDERAVAILLHNMQAGKRATARPHAEATDAPCHRCGSIDCDGSDSCEFSG
jgi:hypothetical protein